MLTFDIETINWCIWVLVAIFGICAIIQFVYYLYFYTGILSWKKRKEKGKVSFSSEKPSVSVIICAKNESENIEKFLPSVLNQDYPNFEVVVINDGSTDRTEKKIMDFSKEYPNIKYTFVPEKALVLSTKKLALTLGVKCAQNDLLLFTDADCEVVSKDWISSIVRNFINGKDFVFGYGGYRQKKGILSHLISYDTFFIAMQYMGFAFRGHPYMAVGRNMAYRRNIFFENNGFASILHLQSGDDDLFVNKNAKKNNTRIEINPESITLSEPKESFLSWYIQKERHLSTAPYYKKESKNLIGAEVLSRELFYLFFILIACFAPLLLTLISCGIFLIRYIMQAIIINKSAKCFNERSFFLSILCFDIFLPLVSLYAMVSNNIHKTTKYRWK